MNKKTTTNQNTEIKSFENFLKALGQHYHLKEFYFKKSGRKKFSNVNDLNNHHELEMAKLK